jgi:hypothetical protein
MRVWDFEWQLATKGWGTGEDQGEIRLLSARPAAELAEGRLKSAVA